MDNGELTILHVEDDHHLADLVKTAFNRFGFRGDMLSARSVAEATGVLDERARNRKPLSLIISDMQLPDGTGLDVIHEVKTNPAWSMTPVIVLSHDVDEGLVNEAYALGANCYMPKFPASKNLLSTLKILYQHWLEDARLPRTVFPDRLQESLERAIGLRARTAELYLSLARASEGAPDELAFWLDRALNEGNLSNLLAFFLNKVHETEVPPGTIDRFTGMQMKVKNALKTAEDHLLGTPAPAPALAYQWALELTDALDEEVFAEAVGVLFPVSSVATTALKERASAQIKELASHILERTRDEALRQKAHALLDRFRRIRPDHP
jgi:DNA-binding response OmpR family regulator